VYGEIEFDCGHWGARRGGGGGGVWGAAGRPGVADAAVARARAREA
jgi:hypothetical protein